MDDLKEVFADICEPLLFQNMLRDPEGSYEWQLLKWSFSELADKFGSIKLPFRIGYNARFMAPQWEAQCAVKYMTLHEFIETVQNSEDNETWYYFDYKYIQEWFKDQPEITESLNWNKFGIDKDGSDSTIWIGNKGAHTHCHQDSYGYNLIAQIHGKKQWLLFPPDASDSLEPIRIPYEESTIYSHFNFFSLCEEDEKKIMNMSCKPKLVTLEPGDVLFVPWGWWHYVESLDCSMSVNIWLPLKEDNKTRLKEALVKMIVAKIGGQDYIMLQDKDNDMPYYIGLIDAVLQECLMENEAAIKSPTIKKSKQTLYTAEELVTQYPDHIKLLDNLEEEELQNFLQNKRERFPESSMRELPELSEENKILIQYKKFLESVVDALCHPSVINKAAELLLSTNADS